MKSMLSFAIVACAASAAAATDVRPALPPVEHVDTEVVTNVAISAAVQCSCEYAFELEFSGTASNNVEIAFGADADGDGALSSGEVGISAGWDCGEWFVLNAVTGERVSVAAADGAHELAGRIRLRRNGCVKEIDFRDGATELFPSIATSAAPWSFPAGWDMVRLVGRGENVRSGESFHVAVSSFGLMLRLK